MLKEKMDSLRNWCSEKWQKWSLRDSLYGLFPILQWLPEYKLKRDLPGDLAAGLTLGIMNIPQGLAFAMLASLPAITGLYVAFIPVFAYVVLGTSKHLSVGTFAVISIMVAKVIDGRMNNMDSPRNASEYMLYDSTPSGGWSAEDKEKIVLSATLCLVVGIVQTAMGFLRFGFITIFLSDSLISGFTTGAACWVFVSQFKHIVAIYPPKYSEPFALVKTCIAIFRNIKHINVASVVIGVLCIILLLLIKYINEKYKTRIKFPIPAELIVVALSAGISYGAKLKQKYHIKIVESVPLGLPPLTIPRNDLIPDLFVDGCVIAVIAFAVNISLAKLFSQKHGYPMDANQELIAYGVQNIVSGFFSCFVSAAALGRSLIQENLGRTQIASVISCAFILLVLTVLAPLFEPLPNAVLAAIIIVAIRRIFINFTRVKRLWEVNKIDSMTWIVTWAAVILFGIDLGLGLGVLFSVLSLVYRLSKPKLTVLGEICGMVGVYDDINRFEGVKELPGVVIVRFQSPLCFINAERFKEKLQKCVFLKTRNHGKAKTKHNYQNSLVEKNLFASYGSIDRGEPFFEEKLSSDSNSGRESRTKEPVISKSEHRTPTIDYVHSVLIDCSTFNFIDSMAVSTLWQIAHDYEEQDVKLYLVNYSYEVLKVLKTSIILIDEEKIGLFPTISEALHHAYKKRHKKIINFMEEDDMTSHV